VAFQKLAREEEIPPGQTKFLQVGKQPVVLANYGGRIYAVFGLCPHQNNPLEGTMMWDKLIDCPFHHFQYDVTTGENFFPRNVYPKDCKRLEAQLRPLRTYAVELREGEVWVNLE
jgi:3-phenylpropionate/trans-cinnamate dioxygenase ferredoxin subunit